MSTPRNAVGVKPTNYTHIQHLHLFRTMLNGESLQPCERCLPLRTCLPFLEPGRSHLFPWMFLPTDIPLFWVVPGATLLPLQKALSSRTDGSGSNSWGYMSRQHVNRYQTRPSSRVLPFALQNFVGNCARHCLDPDLVEN